MNVNALMAYGTASCAAGIMTVWQFGRYRDCSYRLSKIEKVAYTKSELLNPEQRVSNTERLVKVKVEVDKIFYDEELSIGPRAIPYQRKEDNTVFGGYYAISPCRTKTGEKVLLNRGWTPINVEPADAWERDNENSFMVGVRRDPETPSWFTPPAPLGDSRLPARNTALFASEEVLKSEFGPAVPPLLDIIEPQINGWPRRKRLANICEEKIPPAQHAAYVSIWTFITCVCGYFAWIRGYKGIKAPPLPGSPLVNPKLKVTRAVDIQLPIRKSA